MKVAPLTLSLLLFAFIIKLPLLAFSEQVLDTNGNPVVPNHSYDMESVDGVAGELILGITGKSSSECRVPILQYISSVFPGMPVRISISENNIINNSESIFTKIPIDIEFAVEALGGAEFIKWVMFNENENDTSLEWVSIENCRSVKDVNGTFHIEKYDNVKYVLMFCSNYPIGCGFIERYRYESLKGRGESLGPFLFRFRPLLL